MTTEGTGPTEDISPEQERNAPTYPDVRTRQIASSLNIRIYGIPITDDGKLDGYISMVFCGFQIEGYEHRDCSSRIWHVPESQILSTGVVEDFVCDGNDVRFFDVPKDTSPIEEKYVLLSLGMLVRDTIITAEHPVFGPPSSVLAARVGEVVSEGEILSSGSIAAREIGGGGTPAYHTTWVWTKEVINSRYDPMTDPDEGDPGVLGGF